MKNSIIFITLATLLAVVGCRQHLEESFDWDNQDKIEYTVDYTACFTADYDSTLQVTATSNYGSVRVVQQESENLLDADGKPVKNTFIILEDTVPMGKSITLNTGGLSYVGGKPEFLHVQIVGSDDMVELRILDSDIYSLYSIRDNIFFGPDEKPYFTINEGQHFTITLPIMTEERYPKAKESHSIKISFDIAHSEITGQ